MEKAATPPQHTAQRPPAYHATMPPFYHSPFGTSGFLWQQLHCGKQYFCYLLQYTLGRK